MSEWRCSHCGEVTGMMGHLECNPGKIETWRRANLDSAKRALGELQHRISAWVAKCFGSSNLFDRHERTRRVVEEAIELCQAEGLRQAEVVRIAVRVYSRPAGEPDREAAGVGLTLLAWHQMDGSDPINVMQQELERVEALPIEHFRKKHQDKVAAGTGRPMDEN